MKWLEGDSEPMHIVRYVHQNVQQFWKHGSSNALCDILKLKNMLSYFNVEGLKDK